LGGVTVAGIWWGRTENVLENFSEKFFGIFFGAGKILEKTQNRSL